MVKLRARLEQIDWQAIGAAIDRSGYAVIQALLDPAECAELASTYSDARRFRSRIEMARFRFGVGEYKYFAQPLPPVVQTLREICYPRLAPMANCWAERLKMAPRYPATLDEFLTLCRAHGQSRPTPLLLRYETGGYNCLHQDLYGEVYFPLQMTCVLSQVEKDFTGGEFILLEQRPRMQSRGEVIQLNRGDAIIFATNFRPLESRSGYVKATVRHGISTIRAGTRLSLGVIFHDAK